MLCKILPRVSSTSYILYPPPPAHSKQRHWIWVVHSVHLYGIQPYFIIATSMQEVINLRAELQHSLSPSTHYCRPHRALIRALICSGYLQRKAETGITLYCKAELLMWAGLSAKHTSMPCLHEQRWWNKLDIWARTGNFYLFGPTDIRSTVSKVTFQIAQIVSMDNSLPALRKHAL